MNPIVKKNALNYGLMIAGINILYYLVGYIAYKELFVNWAGGLILLVTMIVINIIAVNSCKKEMGGYISFKDGFTAFFLTWLGASLIGTIFNIVLFSVVDPEFGREIQEMIIRSTIQMLENFNTPQEQVDQTLEQLKGQNQFSLPNQVRGFLTNLIVGAIIGLIVAAVMKKDRPMFDDETLDA